MKILNWLSYPRSLVACALYPFFLVFCSLSCVVCNVLFNNRRIDWAVIQFWSRGTCWMFGVKVKVQGLENMPSGGCLYLFNHTSFFDIFSMNVALPDFRFGAKIELFDIPAFGWAMRRAGVLAIDRGNREGVFQLYESSQSRVQRGERFALAPEGTRQSSDRLAPFKTGPFIFAINAKAPIVPVILKNARQVMSKDTWIPNWGVWTQTIHIQVLPFISTENFKIQDRSKLQALVYDVMSPHFTARQD